MTRLTRLTVTFVMFWTAFFTFSCTFSATEGMRAPKRIIRCRVIVAVPSRISTATGVWMLEASSRFESFLFCLPQETPATPSISSAAQRAIFASTSVEI